MQDFSWRGKFVLGSHWNLWRENGEGLVPHQAVDEVIKSGYFIFQSKIMSFPFLSKERAEIGKAPLIPRRNLHLFRCDQVTSKPPWTCGPWIKIKYKSHNFKLQWKNSSKIKGKFKGKLECGPAQPSLLFRVIHGTTCVIIDSEFLWTPVGPY